jgi:uncharacterized protein HemX
MLKENQFAEQSKSEQNNHLVEQLQSKINVLNEELRASKGNADELRNVINEMGEEVGKLRKCKATLERAQADSEVRVLDLSNQLVGEQCIIPYANFYGQFASHNVLIIDNE